MALDPWPAQLPTRFRREGFQETIPDGRLRSQMDTGPAKVRRRSSAMVRNLSGVMIMTEAQREALTGFINVILLGGVLPFTFPDPTTREPIVVRFGERLPELSVYKPGQWLVMLDLEVLPS